MGRQALTLVGICDHKQQMGNKLCLYATIILSAITRSGQDYVASKLRHGSGLIKTMPTIFSAVVIPSLHQQKKTLFLGPKS
ncbi:hypothetical protein HNQ65_003325 [Prosthecobacter vanneervenii]|uniref:Uncharacterized protein n=1 Tax=Prosthecobacter vanneervenii TaxID=48466 RepID=A0A7W7YDA7_9BACT|nr:hypothetical protein [Prosthecobacter vanneervenii]